MRKKVLFVILDGIADNVENTQLMIASKPNIDLITRNGFSGLIENKTNDHPDSGLSNFVLLGCEKEEYPGRGYFEALGINLKIIPGSVYVRANFATVKEEMTTARPGTSNRISLSLTGELAGIQAAFWICQNPSRSSFWTALGWISSSQWPIGVLWLLTASTSHPM